MGTEAVWVPLALSALSAGASYYNTQRTAHKQDNQLASQIRMQQGLQHKADARTSQLITQQAGMSDKPQKAQDMAQFSAQLAANNPQALNPLKSVGAVSNAYKQAGANAAQGVTSYGNNLADLTSSIAAPTQERRDNIKNLDDYSIDLGGLKRQLSGNDFLAQMKLASIRRNPGIDLASSLLKGASSAYGSYAGGASSGNAALGVGSGLDNADGSYDYLNDVMSRYKPGNQYGYGS